MDGERFDRYEGVFACLEDLISAQRQNVTILEAGISSFARSAKWCRFWREQTGGRCTYIGFDEFEDKARAEHLLKKSGADVTLVNGDAACSIESLAGVMRGKLVPDLVVVGHVLPAMVAETWAALQPLLTPAAFVVFDHYSDTKPAHGSTVCVDGLAAGGGHTVEFLQPVDAWDTVGTEVRLALVKKKQTQTLKKAA